MELMSVCCRWILYLGVVSAADISVVKVKIGKPVTLHCAIDVEDNVDVASKKIEWKTLDQMVAKFLDKKVTPGCGYENRVQMFKQNIEKGNLSLTITPTLMSDYGEYECHYNRQHKKSWSLQITANIPGMLKVTVGQPIWIPCYSRRKKCNGDGEPNTDPISFEWLKDNQRVYCMQKGGIKAPGRADVSPNGIRDGNVSLFFHTAYFSDSGTYRCSQQNETTVLKLNIHKKEVPVSMKDPLSLPLYTVDPVDVYFQKDGSSNTVLLSAYDKNWKYINKTQTLELLVVMRKHLGTYTVKDRKREEIFCTYIVTSPDDNVTPDESKYKNALITILILICIATVVFVYYCYIL
ncbi:uncharacterized protein LOC121682352 [Alosa sapidissima]|uniref:uncharacterized protein LOC121682352 n=1 Tax=Alosa sapidissima TaxID=34773 RepID=UPI001C094DF1|nr:uncharacterized protein LOC121682352 [Alosa sapidissima]XP_041918397.1 uncharacterized protein LOC121682352 [Alosa sapidissima]XP_041918398.1 uncharacterized protein LOC121682352 [Alosa sapidissima]